jgi:hypothetical protein
VSAGYRRVRILLLLSPLLFLLFDLDLILIVFEVAVLVAVLPVLKLVLGRTETILWVALAVED